MVTLSSILAWRIPWTEEPGGLQSMESQSRTQLSDISSNKAKFRRVVFHIFTHFFNLSLKS